MTDAARREAASRPGSWVYAIDPFFDSGAKIPPYGIIGAWKVDDLGHMTGEFKRNPNYRPSPASLGMPDPTDAVDYAIQLAATGYTDDAAVRNALLDATLFLVPGAEAVHTESQEIVLVYTSTRHAPRSAPDLKSIQCKDLLSRLPSHVVLQLNHESPASVQIPVADLKRVEDA
ncbi:type VII secretion system-associated protein [Streptomyces sp. NPDC006274]|uniref:type VII secretion system-associated protein n=1 Tax=unclassified Streptomyces TaxID=2593676 RepID=UPI0033BA7EC0